MRRKALLIAALCGTLLPGLAQESRNSSEPPLSYSEEAKALIANPRYGNGSTIDVKGLARLLQDRTKANSPYDKILQGLMDATAAGRRIDRSQLTAIIDKGFEKKADEQMSIYQNGAQAMNQRDLAGYLADNNAISKVPSKPQNLLAESFKRAGIPYSESLHVNSRMAKLTLASPLATDSNGSGGDIGPATFNWTVASKAKATYMVDGALSYALINYSPVKPFEWIAGVEAHTSNDKKASQDSISFQSPFEWRLPSSPYSVVKGQILWLNPYIETDREAKQKDYGGSFLYKLDLGFNEPPLSYFGTASIRRLSYNQGDFLYNIGYDWSPYVGFEGGYTAGALKGNQTHDFGRPLLWLHGDLYLSNNFVISADYYHRQFLVGNPDTKFGNRSFDYVEVSPTFYFPGLSEVLSLSLTYRNGKTTPSFKAVDSLSIGLGLKF